MARHAARQLAPLLAAAFVLALTTGFTACNGSSDSDAPPQATETAPQTAVPMEPPAGAPPTATTPTPTATPAPLEGRTATALPVPPTAVSTTIPLLIYDRSGAITEPGHYAFLADPHDPSSVVSTYEELRDGTATALLIHTTDAHGGSQAALYDAVETGDLVEWRQTAECWVRYQVTAVKPDPAGAEPRKLLAVAWMTYAFAGCSGAVATTTAATLEWGDLPNLGGPSLTTPIQHGPFQLVPDDWTGTVEPGELPDLPAGVAGLGSSGKIHADDRAEMGQRLYWRDPRPPPRLDRWILDRRPDRDTPWVLRPVRNRRGEPEASRPVPTPSRETAPSERPPRKTDTASRRRTSSPAARRSPSTVRRARITIATSRRGSGSTTRRRGVCMPCAGTMAAFGETTLTPPSPSLAASSRDGLVHPHRSRQTRLSRSCRPCPRPTGPPCP